MRRLTKKAGANALVEDFAQFTGLLGPPTAIGALVGLNIAEVRAGIKKLLCYLWSDELEDFPAWLASEPRSDRNGHSFEVLLVIRERLDEEQR